MTPKTPRRLLLQATLSLLGMLTIVCIATAFMGTNRTRNLMNSSGFAVGWSLLLLSLFAAFLFLPRHMIRAGNLAIHLGCALILLGGMVGSEAGHRAAQRLWGSRKVHNVNLRIPIGQTARLPDLGFDLHLHHFRTEFYPTESPWRFAVTATQRDRAPVVTELPLEPGAKARLPFADATLEVLNVETWARLTSPSLLLAEWPDGNLTRHALPRHPGETAPVGDASIRVRRFFTNLRVRRDDGRARIVDAPGPRYNPAVELEWARSDGKTTRTLAFPPHLADASIPPEKGVRLVYLPAGRPLYGLSPPLAVRVSIRRPGARARVLWVSTPLYGDGVARLDFLYDDAETWMRAGAPSLHLLRPPQQPSEFLSDVGVIRGGHEVARQTIEVNHPLAYGGYHIYQTSYDKEGHTYSVLKIRSDSGVVLAYIGFGLLIGGLFRQLWRPRREAVHGD